MPYQALKIRNRAPRVASISRTNVSTNLPAPVNGLNYRNPITQQDPKDAIVLTNLIARPYGVELRKGWQYHTDTLGGSVKTLLAHTPLSDPIDRTLFAAVSTGDVYDVTTRNAPVLSINIADQDDPGHVSYTNFVTEGDAFLCAVFPGAGYYIYSVAGGWVNIPVGVAALQLEFPPGDTTTPAEFSYITSWKNRLFFVKRETGRAYFLPVGQIAGLLEVFDFGPMFTRGGYLDIITTWTMDGGDGIDDRMVIIGSGGDLLIYAGTDPSDSSLFNMIGRWYVGVPPTGKRYFSVYGGDIVIVTTRGLVFLSELLQFGGKFQDFSTSSGKVNQRLSALVAASLEDQYWEVRYLLKEQIVLINMPTVPGLTDNQIVFDVNATAFSMFDNAEMFCTEVFGGELFFGMETGETAQGLIGDNDGQTVADVRGEDLEGEVQTAWQPNGDGSVLKRYLLVQPFFISSAPPSVKIQINTDWRTSGVVGAPDFVEPDQSVWDTALWDIATWQGGANSYKAWAGCHGLGYYASLRMKIRAEPGTVFTNYVLVAEVGGIL